MLSAFLFVIEMLRKNQYNRSQYSRKMDKTNKKRKRMISPVKKRLQREQD